MPLVNRTRVIRCALAACAIMAALLVAACSGGAGVSMLKAKIAADRLRSIWTNRSMDASGESSPPSLPSWVGLIDPSLAPRPTLPASTRWGGKTAAHKLLGITTTFPTVSHPPAWAARFGGVIDGVATNQRVVALTFDDGPTLNTREIVNDLKTSGDHATFFWVGSRITTDAARYSLAAGEELANHTWNHPNMWKLDSAEASAEIGLTSARIAQFTGRPPTWFRSPFNRLFRAELGEVKAHHLLYANYNVTSVDWMPGASAPEILQKISDGLKPGGVILMHDSPNHDPASFLPQVLSLLKARGYRVVTMSQLAQMGPPVDEPLTLGIKGLGY
jgi:peptidoglycan/xylan/chitin deacetylase (PgdA/CDA1 family)